MKAIYILIITHGNLAKELRETAEDIMGIQNDLGSYCISREKTLENIKKELDGIVSGIINDKQLFVMTDMIGGTPSNVTFKYLDNPEIEVLAGVNLPMLVSSLNKRRSINIVKDLAMIIETSARESIVSIKNRLNS